MQEFNITVLFSGGFSTRVKWVNDFHCSLIALVFHAAQINKCEHVKDSNSRTISSL